MRFLIIPAALVLVSCGGAGFEEAQKRYDFLEANGASDEELCREARKVAEIAADERRTTDYQLWDANADLHCSAASIDRL